MSRVSFSVPDDWKSGRIWVGYQVHSGHDLSRNAMAFTGPARLQLQQ